MSSLIQQAPFRIQKYNYQHNQPKHQAYERQNTTQKLFEWLDTHVDNLMVQPSKAGPLRQHMFRFRVAIPGGEQICFRGVFMQATGGLKLRGSLCSARGMVAPRSSELNRQMVKLITNLNNYGRSSSTCFALHPQFGQVNIVQTLGSTSLANPVLLLRARMEEALSFAQNFVPYLLYQANLISYSGLMKRNSMFTQSYVKSRKRNDFHRLGEMMELLPLMNIPIKYQDGGKTMQAEDVHDFTCRNIVDLFYKQTDSKQLTLFSQPPKYEEQQPIHDSFGVQQIQAMLRPPVKKVHQAYEAHEGNEIQNTLRAFNTVVIKDCSESKVVAQGGWSMIEIADVILKVMQSTPSLDMETRSTTVSESESDQIVKGNIKRRVLAKIPKCNSPPQKTQSMVNKIKYQKHILQQFRGAKTRLMTKYFHTTQSNFKYSQYLLMDPIPGRPIIDEFHSRKNSLSLVTKIFWLLGAISGVKFLEDYGVGHMDLSPNNLIVAPMNQIKMIDFGEAYHPIVSRPFIPHYNQRPVKWVYSPGRTFPYAPPQTSIRNYDLGSQQDVFSLGMLAFFLLFGQAPINCSDHTNQEIYHKGTYFQRLFMAPEQVVDLGPIDMMSVYLNMAFKMVSVDERKRPLPIWLHILVVQLLDFIPK